MSASRAERIGLGDPAMMEKIDNLFACGVGDFVALPQIVVVGDQSSGKSSVLEGLIRMPLPRDSGLCTRFATQFMFRRADKVDISVSIIPDHASPDSHIFKMRAWRKDNLTTLDSDEFVEIMQEVHKVMGLSGGEDSGEKKPTFSNDVLRLEISGPDQEHLSVIDVPGIFKSTTDGLTTKQDIELVRHMVLGYMKNPRSIMLTVIPANVDVATQEILEMAKEVDPSGDRTLGVLTKPDLVDRGAESRVVDLVNGSSYKLKLGWNLVRNPGQQDLSDSTLDRSSLEMNFFRIVAPWSAIAKDKVGVESLRDRLKEILAGLIKTEFPKVQQEIRKRLAERQKAVAALGPERESSATQMASLTEIATKFQRLVSLALAANYGADSEFDTKSSLRIAPSTTARMTAFSDDMSRYGQQYSFLPSDHVPGGSIAPALDGHLVNPKTFLTRKQDDIDELIDILHPQQDVPHSIPDAILPWLLAVYNGNRGFELGTFNATILATAMKKQSSKWSNISLAYVSDVIVMVHRFIKTALQSVCPDADIRHALFGIMTDTLIVRYQKAIDHTCFLLQIEDVGTPMTLNHYFNENLQKSRQGKVAAAMKGKVVDLTQSGYGKVVRLDDVTKGQSMGNEQHLIHDIHDILQSYYKVTRKTFVDNVCKQATGHFLLASPDSPLLLFSPVFVSHLSTSELESIAGESPGMKRRRAQLRKEIDSLTEARKILTRA